MNRTWVQRRDAERRGAAPGQAGFCGVAQGPGCPKLWSPGAGTPVGARTWVGGIPVLQITRITPKEKNGTPQNGVLGPQLPLTRVRVRVRPGTSGPRREAASASRLLGDPSGAGGNFAPWWSDSPARALLVGMGKSWAGSDLAHPSSGLSTGSRWLGGQLLGSSVSASQTPPHTHFLCGQRVTPCWAKLLLVESHARAAMAAGYSAPCLHPLSSDGSVSSQSQRLPQPYQLPWSLQNHPTFLETGQQKSGERGSSAGKQLNNREACLHTHYPEPDCPRTSHRAGSRTPLILCIFILLTLKDSGRKKNNAAQEK